MNQLSKNPKLWVAALVIAANLVVAISSFAWLNYSRDRYNQTAAESATNLVRLVEVSVSAIFRSIDVSMQAMAREIASCRARSVCNNVDSILERHGYGITESQVFMFAATDGQVVGRYSSRPDFSRAKAQISDRDYFRKVVNNPERGLVIYGPIVGRISGRWALVMARPVMSTEGALQGVVIGSLDLEFLQKLLDKVSLGEHGALSIRDEDMAVILRFPEPRGIGANLGSKNISPQLQAFLDSRESAGVYRAVTPLDGIERTVAFIRSQNFPIYVNAGLASTDYLAPLSTEFWVVVALQVVVLILSLFAGWHLYRFYTGQAMEIALRKTTEEELLRVLQEHRAILQSEVVGFVMLNGREITWINPAFAHMLGYEDWELVEKTERVFFTDDETHDAFCRVSDPVVQAGKIYRTQIQLQRKNGVLGWFDLSGAQLRPRERDFIWALVDISEQKRTESELILAQELAEQANKAKSRFLATMSHEIRTPMNGILGMAQLLFQPSMQEEERRDCARTILNSGQMLLTLLNDILDLSKVEAGRIELDPVPFGAQQVLHETSELFKHTAANKGLKIATEWAGPELRYQGDVLRIRQMISNLVNNAIKFTPKGSIALSAREIRRDNAKAVIEFSVKDTGIGISEEKVSLLFKAFSQADTSTTRQYGGTGLGLSIVRNLAELMGGDVGVESELSVGSRFWFRINVDVVPEGNDVRQLAREAQDLAAAPAKKTLPTRFSGRVLVVEDNPTNRKVIEVMLTRMGVKVSLAEDGAQGLDAVVNGPEKMDLILMDIQMPVMDGYEATKRIRQWEQDHGKLPLPIVAVTADAFEEDRQRCMDVGMDEFLTKPVSVDQIRGALSRWLPSSEHVS